MTDKNTFEYLLNELEIIVRNLEEGNLSLDESKNLFLQGLEIAKKCKLKLSETKMEIEDISKDFDFNDP